ncbi:diphosphomevalonate decarboxylase [Colletotrichum chrysophilum]|uniref:diphosphomevalonate decarboxylase n=2 Tax=Colletotrichum chrysophilum TaxID=1836956 RepID=A0AAD9EH95_9PEZI|nr:diphosphomevalonate decarboxylase [Colletotrichum chrysophilum]
MADTKVYRASTTAPVNIAVVKYWGKRDAKLNLPTNSSLSVTLSQADLRTLTTASCSASYTDGDSLILNGESSDVSGARTQACFRELRARRAALEAQNTSLPKLSTYPLKIVTENNFPTAAGLASSAAGFAALVRAIADLYELPDSPSELSLVARQGSGSACRSLFGGYVAWRMGEQADGSDSKADLVAEASHWPEMRALILVVSAAKKGVSSTSGMQQTVATSGLFKQRVAEVVPKHMAEMEDAIARRDFAQFAEVTMKDSNSFHSSCSDTYPPIFYMNDVSRAAIRAVEQINAAAGKTVAAYTFDAGPNAVIYYLEENAATVVGAFTPVLSAVTGWKDGASSLQSPVTLDETVAGIIKGGVSRVIQTGVGEGPIKSDIYLVGEDGQPAKRATRKMASSKEPKAIVIDERDSSGLIRRRWLHDSDGRLTEMPTENSPTTVSRLLTMNIRQVFSDAFFPIGYPDSVSKDYLGYQLYDSLQAFFSTITSLLANRAILQGLGVGDADSSATYALLLTILKDGISRLATIGFAYRFGLVIEPECKKYRFLADIFNDSAFFLDLFSPLFGSWTKVAALVVAEALRAMCGVAAGASKAALSKHFALRGNLSELNAKESSQETAVGLIGLIVGSFVVRHVESREAVFALMIILVFVHLGMNYLGVRCVQLNNFNQQRATIFFEEYMKTMGNVRLTPAEVAKRENIIFWKPVIYHDGRPFAKIVFAKSYADAMASGSVVLKETKQYKLCQCNTSGLVVIKILLFGHPLSEGISTTTLYAWFSAVSLVHSMMPDNDLERDYVEKLFANPSHLARAGWVQGDVSLDTSAAWMLPPNEDVDGKKDL